MSSDTFRTTKLQQEYLVMVLRHLRLFSASLATVAAIIFAPARSEAGIQILVEELDASSNVVGTPAYFNSTPNGSTPFSQAFSFTGTQFSIVGGVMTNSQLGAVPASLSTNFGVATLVANPTDSIRITVTDDGFTAGGGLAATLSNSASVSVATGSAAEVTSFSRALNTPLSFPTSSTTNPADGTTAGGPTDVAEDIRPDTLGISPVTTAFVPGLPDQYALQQVIIVSIPPGVNTPANTTFSGTAGVMAAPVPAPGGLALALIGLPLIGLRRALRKRTQTA